MLDLEVVDMRVKNPFACIWCFCGIDARFEGFSVMIAPIGCFVEDDSASRSVNATVEQVGGRERGAGVRNGSGARNCGGHEKPPRDARVEPGIVQGSWLSERLHQFRVGHLFGPDAHQPNAGSWSGVRELGRLVCVPVWPAGGRRFHDTMTIGFYRSGRCPASGCV